MAVHVDIAGIYFGIDVPFVEGETIRDLMLRIQTLTGAPDYPHPRAEFFEDMFSKGGFTLDGVTITHRKNSAKSRQNVRDDSGQIVGRRQYDNGIYHFSDDSILPSDVLLAPLSPADPNKAFVSAWQYYVYDADGRDLARIRGIANEEGLPGGKEVDREIIPYGDKSTTALVQDGYTIVWRLVTIFVRPTHAGRNDINFATKNSVKLA